MNKKNIIKMLLDIIMLILFITFFEKNLISVKFHMISGIVFAVCILIHIFLNRNWVIQIGKRLFNKKTKLRAKISYLLSFLLFISIALIILSGICLVKASTYDRVMFWKMLHFGASYISLALIGAHLGLYWSWVMNLFRKIFNLKESKKCDKIIMGLLVACILLVGAYKVHSENYFRKTLTCVKYVIEHFQPEEIETENKRNYEQEIDSLGELVYTYGSIISLFTIVVYYGDKGLHLWYKNSIEN